MRAWDETSYTQSLIPDTLPLHSLHWPSLDIITSSFLVWRHPPIWLSGSVLRHCDHHCQVSPSWKHCSPHRVQGAWTFTPQYPLLIKIPGFLRMCHVEPHKCSLQTPLLSLSMLISGMNTRPEFFSSRLKVPLKVLGSGLTRHSNFQCLFCLCLSSECPQSTVPKWCSPCCPAIPSPDHVAQLARAFLVSVVQVGLHCCLS